MSGTSSVRTIIAPLGTAPMQLGRIVLGRGAIVVTPAPPQTLWEPVWLVEIETET